VEHIGKPVLVIGATGFVGHRVVDSLIAAGRPVRALVRRPERAGDLAALGVDIVDGDMLDPAPVVQAAQGVAAVIVCVHTLSAQTAREPGQDFMDVEEAGLRNIVEACRTNDVRRLVYVTAIGAAPDALSTWSRGRWRTEQMLLASGLDVTVLRPGMIMGRGGDGFGRIDKGARQRVAFLLASRTQRFRTIAVNDLAQQLVDLLEDPRSFGRAFDVGSDDIYTMDEMIDLAAEYLERKHPAKVHLPRRLIAGLAPVLERAAKMPPGALGGIVGPGSDSDMVGDITPVQALLTHPARPFREVLPESLA